MTTTKIAARLAVELRSFTIHVIVPAVLALAGATILEMLRVPRIPAAAIVLPVEWRIIVKLRQVGR